MHPELDERARLIELIKSLDTKNLQIVKAFIAGMETNRQQFEIQFEATEA